MNTLEGGCFWKRASQFSDEDILIKKLLLTHDPDSRRLDSEMLLQAMENIMFYATPSEGMVSDKHINHVSNIELVGSKEPLAFTIFKISREMLRKCYDQRDLHTRTMILFDWLGNYRWDAKLVLILAAFASSYGEICLLMQLCPNNPVAVSIATLKQLPFNISSLKSQSKALRLLVKTMVGVTKCIIKFESLPTADLELDNETLVITKSLIYAAAYWTARSSLACFSQITSLKAINSEYSKSAIASWELSSLAYRLSKILSPLRQQVDACDQQTEAKLHQKLLNLFKKNHVDNQEVLHILFALENDLPFNDGSTQVKLGVSKLKSKVVILLISKPELLPLERLFLLVHQAYDDPLRKKLQGSYEIVWVPIPFSNTWTDSEVKSFHTLSKFLPWYTVERPWSLRPAMVNYMKQEWNFEGKAIMVVLDAQGTITNRNALDMVLIWGAEAYPFSVSRENELWEGRQWTLQLVIDDIDPLLKLWVEEGRIICLYGSDDIDWIRESTDKLKGIRSSGVQLEMIYVGKNNPNEHVKDILAIINEEMHKSLLSFTEIQFFWLRLESMKRSKLRLGKTASADHILEEVLALQNPDNNDKGWAVFGQRSSADVIRAQGRKLIECLNLFQEWGQNVAHLGFVGAFKAALEPPLHPGPCYQTDVIPYAEELIEGSVACQRCKRPMKKLIVYE